MGLKTLNALINLSNLGIWPLFQHIISEFRIYLKHIYSYITYSHVYIKDYPFAKQLWVFFKIFENSFSLFVGLWKIQRKSKNLQALLLIAEIRPRLRHKQNLFFFYFRNFFRIINQNFYYRCFQVEKYWGGNNFKMKKHTKMIHKRTINLRLALWRRKKMERKKQSRKRSKENKY